MKEMNEIAVYRPELPAVPPRLQKRPVHRGYPVPWFCPVIDDQADFRYADPAKKIEAVRGQRCWTCGDKLGSHLAFVLGPACVINRVSSEPPSHLDCAEFTVQACPFLMLKQEGRREAGEPEGVGDPLHDSLLLRDNPGVSALWMTTVFQPRFLPTKDGKSGTVFFLVGKPDIVEWYARGRLATVEEVEQAYEQAATTLLSAAAKESMAAIDRTQKLVDLSRSLLPRIKI